MAHISRAAQLPLEMEDDEELGFYQDAPVLTALFLSSPPHSQSSLILKG